MKGLIFNLLEEFVVGRHGEEAFEAVVAACGPLDTDPRLMVGPGSYPDHDFGVLVAGTARYLQMPPPRLLYDFGRSTLVTMADRYPQFFLRHAHPRDFLVSMGFVHNLEVKKLYDNASPPSFTCETMPTGGLRIVYRSERHLCSLFSGLIDGTGDYYRVAIQQRHEHCVMRGDQECVFELAFAGIQEGAHADN